MLDVNLMYCKGNGFLVCYVTGMGWDADGNWPFKLLGEPTICPNVR
jgi:hypothetical protein